MQTFGRSVMAFTSAPSYRGTTVEQQNYDNPARVKVLVVEHPHQGGITAEHFHPCCLPPVHPVRPIHLLEGGRVDPGVL